MADLAHGLVNDPESLVRGHCAWALGHIGGKQAHFALQQAFDRESDPYVLQEIQDALSVLTAKD